MKWLSQKTIDIIQWVIIIGLIVTLAIQGSNYRQAKKDLVTQAEYNKENTYVRIYESQKLNKLKRENKELYDSIKNLKDVESAMIIKFKEHYNTETITVDKFIVKHDTIKFYDDNNTLHQRLIQFIIMRKTMIPFNWILMSKQENYNGLKPTLPYMISL